jgi:uncharacterized protein
VSHARIVCAPLQVGTDAFRGISMKPRISMITLGVDDLPRSITFYERGLGFPRLESPPEVAFFALQGTWLALYGRQALAEDAAVAAESAGFPGFSLAHNVDSETEVDAVLALASSAGAVVTRPARRTEWGGYAGYFRDPDGYVWEVAHNPHMRIGPQDESQ